jgi:alpha-galactosidase
MGAGCNHSGPFGCIDDVALKVTFVGAGSAVFARQLITDVLAVEGLDEGVFALIDVDATRLELARQIAERLVELSGKR